MERLIQVNQYGDISFADWIQEKGLENQECFNPICKRLGEYENTGLTPQEVEELHNENAELKTRLEKAVELPCKEFYEKSGDLLYIIDEEDIIEVMYMGAEIDYLGNLFGYVKADEKIFQYREANSEYDSDVTDWCTDIKIVKPDDFGKTVFLTKEAAEQALKERKKNE